MNYDDLRNILINNTTEDELASKINELIKQCIKNNMKALDAFEYIITHICENYNKRINET